MIQISTLINEGMTSKVFDCVNVETSDTYAAKVYHQNMEFNNTFENEVYWLLKLRHPAIIQMIDFINENDQRVILLEKCQVDLIKFIELNGTLSIEKIRNKMNPILEAIKMIHDHEAAHCDIKIDNIGVMYNGDFKLLDFGSCTSTLSNLMNHSGSLFYDPPEIYTESRDLQKGDIWSFGITLYACATGQFPFDGNDDDYFNQVLYFEPDFTLLEIDEEFTDFVSLLRGMLNKSQQHRYSIKDCLEHKFFYKNEFSMSI
jgi:serine/threonine-protein kinase